MKPSRAFWGTLFVGAGVLLLLGKTFDIDIGPVWKFWPMVFVLIGIALLVKHQQAKWILASLAAILAAFVVYSIASLQWLPWHFHIDADDADGDAQVQEFSEALLPGITRATLVLDAAAGNFRIESSTSNLMDAHIRSRYGTYAYSKSVSADEVTLRLTHDNIRIKSWGRHKGTSATVKLNTGPAWTLNVDVGAAKADFDLSPYNIERLTLDAGAADVDVRLGAPKGETIVRVNAGAASVRIEVPEEVGCEVRYSGGLSSKSFSDFRKISDDVYETENFNSSGKKIYIEAETGVSSLRIVRY